MSEERLEERVNDVRRKLLKASAVVGGSVVLGHLTYQKPAWKSFFGVRSAWAQPTSFMQHVLDGQLGTQAPGTAEDTGQDCWEFASASNNNLTINATNDGNLNTEIYLYAPGAVGVGETNLLTGTPFGLDQSGLGGAEGGVVNTPTTGTYTVCIEDQRTAGNQVAGVYQIVIDSTKPMGAATMTADEGPESDAPDRQ
jgi:hypothetical protein